jgi:tight adherence protein C
VNSILFIAETDSSLILLGVAIFGCVAAAAWWVVDSFFDNETRSESRLDELRTRRNGGSAVEKGGGAKAGIAKLLESASPAVSDALQPKNEKEANKIKEKLDSAGFRHDAAPAYFATLKLFSAIAGLFVGGLGSVLVYGLTAKALIGLIVFATIFYMLPSFILGFIASSRKNKIFLGLPDALDLMVVCVEAGLGLDQAMRRVSDELFKSHPVIAHEFKLCNQQLQMGSTRETVLTELGSRNGVADLKTLSSVMIQVDRFGTSVGKALRTQSDAMRVRRRQIAEEKAAKTAVKLIFPLVLFIFPGIFVVLVGPAAIRMVEELGKMRGEG